MVQARNALATSSHLEVVANFQLEEAHRAAFEVLEIIGHSTATEPWAALEGTLFDSPESQECVDSLIEFINSSGMAA